MKNRALLSLLIGLSLLSVVSSGCYRAEAPPDTRTAEQKADSEWFNKKAKELGGDFEKLTPEEKQRAIKSANNDERSARIGFGMAAKQPAR